jgi:hypothetical protein
LIPITLEEWFARFDFDKTDVEDWRPIWDALSSVLENFEVIERLNEVVHMVAAEYGV